MAGVAAKFVQIVEKYQCLYNSNIADYARKDITEKAWSEVANQMNWSVNECKEKWKNIRNGFVRSLKPKPSGSATKRKQYYLHDELQFILPYVKPVIHTEDRGNLPSPAENDESAAFSDPDPNINVIEEIDEDISRIEKPIFKKPKTKIKPITNEADKAFVDWLRTKKPDIEEDPRRMFLLSLLPDVNKLTDDQMSDFRIKVLMLLEEIKAQTSSHAASQLQANPYRSSSNSSTDPDIYQTYASTPSPTPINYSVSNTNMISNTEFPDEIRALENFIIQ